jgi:tetratricopeptide (TPR) repeat protein
VLDVRRMWNFEDPAASEARFRDALDTATEVERDVLRTQIARALALQERYEEAQGLLDEIDSEDDEVRVRISLEGGRVLRSSGDPAAAAPLFERAVHDADAAGLEALAVDALHMVALIREGDDQIAVTEAALARARGSADPEARRWEASLLHNLGMAETERGEWQCALEIFEAALALRRAEGDEELINVGRWMVAWTLRNLGRREEALAQQRALKADLLAAGTDDSYVDEELALLEAD